MRKVNLLYIIILFTVTCNITRKLITESILTEGKGLDKIKLYKSTISDVQKLYGKDFKVIKWGSFSYEIDYSDIGVSFSYKQEDTSRQVRFISVNPGVFNGRTAKGLVIKEGLKVTDVIDIYGKAEWFYTTDSTELSIDYDGISFYVNPNKHFTEINFGLKYIDDSLHTDFYQDHPIADVAIPY
ncbi:MAG: hypothetical protein AAF806_33135 [Bacteroidota bacterium]